MQQPPQERSNGGVHDHGDANIENSEDDDSGDEYGEGGNPTCPAYAVFYAFVMRSPKITRVKTDHTKVRA